MSTVTTSKKAPHNHFLTAIALSAVLLFLHSQNKSSLLTRTLNLALAPMRGPFVSSNLWLKSQAEFFRNLPHQNRIIKDLKRRTNELALLSAKAVELERENANLRAVVNAPILKSHSLLPVKVLGMTRFAIVQGGEKDGIRKDQTVVSEGLYAGVVVEVWQHSSRVRLLFDAETRLEARTMMGTSGIVIYQGGRLLFSQVIQKEPLKSEEPLFTKGNAGIPDGLLIGTVDKIDESPSSVYKSASVEPAQVVEDLKTLNILLD